MSTSDVSQQDSVSISTALETQLLYSRTCLEECMDFYVILLPPLSQVRVSPVMCETGMRVPGRPRQDRSQGQRREGQVVSFWGET